MKTLDRSYSELIRFESFEDRFRYLAIGGVVGAETFRSKRMLNQAFYSSPEWRRFRHEIIIRDLGCDLGIPGLDIYKYAVIHHINPITIEDVMRSSEALLDPENVITVTDSTHKAIHYGDESYLSVRMTERRPNDTCPWKEA